MVRTPAEQQAAQEIAGNLCLYYFATCPYCLRVRRTIDRLHVDIALRDIHRDPVACRELVNGGGRRTVPCLRIDAEGRLTWLYESTDIVHYLKQRFANIGSVA
ncbi:MAG: glutaredoxin [Rhodanobacteraceae bacterium]|nr:MAG: glutaredoxin [Rhodanobacteraceae bacterium]